MTTRTVAFPARKAQSTAQAVAANVKALMATREVTQVQLALAMGISQSAVSKRLRGTVPFDIEDLDRLSAVFGVRVTDLVAWPGDDDTPGRYSRGGYLSSHQNLGSLAVAS